MAKESGMKIILIKAASLDGRFTKGNSRDIYSWTSAEDLSNFIKVKQENNLLVMGSGTFVSVKDIEQAGLKPEKGRLRIVMTENPGKYTKYAVAGQLEFTDESPRQLVARLEKQGYRQMLFVGGSKLLSAFLEAKLITDVWLTLEPRIFGRGDILNSTKDLDIYLELREITRLNKQGTLLLKYIIFRK